MLKQKILEGLKKATQGLGYPSSDIVLSIPKNSTFGDYSTNLALQLAKLEGNNHHHSPLDIANAIVNKLKSFNFAQDNFSEIKIAGAGFINFFVNDKDLISETCINSFSDDTSLLQKSKQPQKVLVEYGHVNLLKEIHIGHLRTFIIGESICRMLEALGNKVFRANYQGDIGLHIAKAIWGIKKLGLPVLSELNSEEKAKFLGKAYAQGSKLYDEKPTVKKEIDQINIQLYQKDPKLQDLYDTVRKWSIEYFEPIYELFGVKYNRCFFESEVFERGKEIVLSNMDKVFVKSEGAIIFPGEKYNLHNRVFISSAGNPTYEAKELGLAELEYSQFEYDSAIHVVASEQAGYFEVVFKAIGLINPNVKDKKYHLSYGLVDLKEGKMSSRSGNVVTVDDLYSVVSEKVRVVMKENKGGVDQNIVKQIAIGAIKFSYLKFSPTPNMVFDLDQSVSLDGDSGPYVQYTYARIQSVLSKGKAVAGQKKAAVVLTEHERNILRQMLYFSEIVEESAASYHPNLLATYLITLSKLYNFFYQECRIIGSEQELFRIELSGSVGKVIKQGLYLLGIETPERM